jgi:hypothetical protein
MRVEVVRYLGFVIDSRLSWQYHILYVRDKVNKGLGMLRRSCHVFPRDCLRLIYFAFVYPYLSTGIQFWGVSTKYNLDMLRTVQKACIRRIVNESYTAHCTPIAKSLEILLLDDLYTFSVACFMHNIFYNCICNVVSSLFKRTNETHTINTRQSEFDFYVPQSNVTSCRWFIVTQGPFVWNNLPEHVKSCVKFPVFKTIVKSMLFDDYD